MGAGGETDKHSVVDNPPRIWYRTFTMKKPQTMTRPAKPCPFPMPSEDPLGSLGADEQLAMRAKALGHPARVRIIRLLLERQGCICGEICEELPLAQSTVSQHLKVLRSSGLIYGEIKAPRVCYCINPNVLKKLKVLVAGLQSVSARAHRPSTKDET